MTVVVAESTCSCPACKSGLDAFTREHFRIWALELDLDSGDPWEVEPFFLDFAEDYFTGVPEAWLIVGEGNTKTTSLAGLALYLLEHRRRAAIPWAASSRDQAEIGYRQAEGFVSGSARLRSFMKCQEGYRRIKNLQSAGRIQIFAADDNHADGIIPTDAFLDELHRHKNLKLYRTWRGKLLKRGGQLATISTAGEPGSEFEDARERIRQEVPVVERHPGFVLCRSEQVVLHEWAVAEGADVEDMDVVKEANPFSGITLEQLALKRQSPTMTPQHWARFVCNLPTRGNSAAIQEREWHDAATVERIPGDADTWVGLDVGWRWDTTAFVPLWWRDDEFRLLGPAVILEPPRDGSSMHPDVVKSAFADMQAEYAISTVVMDTNRAEDLSSWFSDELGLNVVDRAQTSKPQSEDFDRFMEALRQGWLRHAGDGGLRRHAFNAVARLLPDGGAKFGRVSETRQGGNQDARVIDALVAAAMVHSYAVEVHGAPAPFVGVAWA